MGRVFIYKPYLHMKKLYGQFVDGQVFEEMFEYEIGWAPRWDEVMERLHYLLNKQDAIRMSKSRRNIWHCRIRLIRTFCIMRWKPFGVMPYVPGWIA